jgi:hypothetical protein
MPYPYPVLAHKQDLTDRDTVNILSFGFSAPQCSSEQAMPSFEWAKFSYMPKVRRYFTLEFEISSSPGGCGYVPTFLTLEQSREQDADPSACPRGKKTPALTSRGYRHL